jgi:hypothetical protein
MVFKSEQWMNYLRFFKNKTQGNLNIKFNQPNAAVIVEPREDELLDLVINNFMYFLQEDWSLYIFHGNKNDKFVKNITKNMGEVYLINLNVNNLTTNEYSSLLTSENFYKLIHCNNILIFQMDTLLRKPISKEFMEYDYVGAPWTWEHKGWWRGKVGNGGLSFRKKDKMLKIIQTYKYNGGNEDGYFSNNSYNLKYNLPDFETASAFSVETVFHPDPIGLHRPYVSENKDYDKLFEIKVV